MREYTRQGVAALALIGVFVSTYLLLHRLGFVSDLACGPDGGCSFVQSTRFATFAGIPVPLLGVVGYLAILLVALIGTRPGAPDQRWISVALLGLTGGAFAFSMYLTALEAWVINAWCMWCVISAIIATLAFLLSLPEIGRLRRSPAERMDGGAFAP